MNLSLANKQSRTLEVVNFINEFVESLSHSQQPKHDFYTNNSVMSISFIWEIQNGIRYVKATAMVPLRDDRSPVICITSTEAQQAFDCHYFLNGSVSETAYLTNLFMNKLRVKVESLYHSMPELLPCPFCGSLDVEYLGNARIGYYSCSNDECDCLGPTGKGEANALEKWNDRS